MAQLDGKIAIVTGGASGIGEGTVRKFVESGARVVISDVQDARGEKLAEELGPNASYYHTDVAQEEEVRAAVAHAVQKWGRLDVMFNNAGFGGVSGSICDIDMAQYDTTMAVLLRGVVLGMKHAGQVMKAQGRGSIISTASVAGVGSAGPAQQGLQPGPNELGESGVRVNAICPGGIATPIFGKAMGLSAEQADFTVDLMRDRLAMGQPIRRAGLPEDIARAAAWLASDEASFVTGHALVVDGGITTGRLWSERQEAAEQRLAQFKLPGNQ